MQIFLSKNAFLTQENLFQEVLQTTNFSFLKVEVEEEAIYCLLP